MSRLFSILPFRSSPVEPVLAENNAREEKIMHFYLLAGIPFRRRSVAELYRSS